MPISAWRKVSAASWRHVQLQPVFHKWRQSWNKSVKNCLTVLPQIVFQVILFWFPFPKLTFAMSTVVMTPDQLGFSIALLLSDLTALSSQTRSLCASETWLLHLYEPQIPIMCPSPPPPQRVSRRQPSPHSRQQWSVLVSDVFLSEMVLERAAVWVLVDAWRIAISWIWTINPQPNQFFFSPVGTWVVAVKFLLLLFFFLLLQF